MQEVLRYIGKYINVISELSDVDPEWGVMTNISLIKPVNKTNGHKFDNLNRHNFLYVDRDNIYLFRHSNYWLLYQ